MKKILAALVLAASLILVPAAPAQAHVLCQASGIGCPDIKHYSPDGGYDADIKIRCDVLDGIFFIAEGNTSKSMCPDLGSVYVRSNEEIWCKYDGTWKKKFDAQGWHDVGAFWNDGSGCTVRRD